MTLIIGVAYRDLYVMISSDSKISKQTHSVFDFEKTQSDVEGIEGKAEKVSLLTNYVLCSQSGVVDIGEVVERELRARVKPYYRLNQCAKVLKEIISDLKNDKVPGLTARERLSVKFLETKHYSCYLIGFNSNGRTGMCYHNPHEKTVESLEAPLNGPYPTLVNSPHEDDAEFESFLLLPKDEQNIQNFATRFAYIQAHLLRKHPESISADCNFDMLIKRADGKIVHHKQTFDVSEIEVE